MWCGKCISPTAARYIGLYKTPASVAESTTSTMRSITIFFLLSAVCAVALGQWGGQPGRLAGGIFGQMMGGMGSQPGGGSNQNPLANMARQFGAMLPSGNGEQRLPGGSQQGQTRGQEQGMPGEGFLEQMRNTVTRGFQQGDRSGQNPMAGMMGQIADRLSSSGNGEQRLPWGSQQGEAQELGGGLPGHMGSMLNGVNEQLQSMPWSSWLPQNNNRNREQQPDQQQQQQLSRQQPGVDNNAKAQDRRTRPVNTQNNTPAQ